MTLKTKEAIFSIYNHTRRMLESATKARNITTSLEQKIMLSGKIKAYAQVMSRISDKHKTDLLPDFDIQ